MFVQEISGVPSCVFECQKNCTGKWYSEIVETGKNDACENSKVLQYVIQMWTFFLHKINLPPILPDSQLVSFTKTFQPD
jgi:hypothetical protein